MRFLEVPLSRAESILQCYVPKAKIITIDKMLDDVTREEIQTDDNSTKLHLFSNILDVEGFDIAGLLQKILVNKGLHYFLAVSHDRDFEGGSERLKEAYYNVTRQHTNLTIKEHKRGRFKAGDKPAIYFIILFEI